MLYFSMLWRLEAGFMVHPEGAGETGQFLAPCPAPPKIKRLGGTKSHDKTFAVLGGFWHSVA